MVQPRSMGERVEITVPISSLEIDENMLPSERFIPPSDEEWQRLQQAPETAKEFDRQRGRLFRATLRNTRCDFREPSPALLAR